MRTWFNGLAREVLTEEELPVSVSIVATGNTVATFQGYPSLLSDDSGSEVEMEGQSHPAIDDMAEIRQQFQLHQAQLTETKEKLVNIEQKDKDKSFAQTWHPNHYGKTHLLELWIELPPGAVLKRSKVRPLNPD